MSNTTVLGSIRSKIWLILVVIGISLLAFIFDPQTISNFSLVSRDVVGKVNGEKILVSDFNDMLDQVSNNPQFQGMPRNMLAIRIWDEMVQQKVIEEKFKNLGLEVTDAAVTKYISQDPQVAQNPEFQDQSGKFSMARLEAWINTKTEEAKKGNTQAVQQIRVWEMTQKNIKKSLITNGYLKLVSVGLMSNDAEVAFIKKQLVKKAKANYVKLPYSEFVKKAGKISDDEIQEYIEKNPKQFEVKENRDLGYVLFAAEPSKKDMDVSLNEINSYITGKISTDAKTGITDTIQAFGSVKNDSLYVVTYSEQPYTNNYFVEGQLPPELQNFAKSASVGSVSQPIKIQNIFILSKLEDKRNIVDSTEVSHILIGHSETAQKINKRSRAEALSMAENLLGQIKSNPMKFYESLSLSDDKGSIQTGGKYVVIRGQNQFVPEFINFAENNSVGTIDIVESQFGFHIMKVDKKSAPKMGYKLANIVKTIQLSPETTSSLYKKATTLIQKTKGKSLSEFANYSRRNGFKYFTSDGIEYFGTLNNLNSDKDQEIIKWAFDKKRELGETNMFTTSNGDYIVTYLSGINEEGLESVKKARNKVEPILRNQKIAKAIEEEISKMGNKTLSAVAQKYGKSIKSTEVLLAGNVVDGVNEPKVVGSIFALKTNQTSKLIDGNEGVYLVQQQSLITDSSFPIDDNQIKIQLDYMNRNNLQTIMKDIKDQSDILDNRKNVLQ